MYLQFLEPTLTDDLAGSLPPTYLTLREMLIGLRLGIPTRRAGRVWRSGTAAHGGRERMLKNVLIIVKADVPSIITWLRRNNAWKCPGFSVRE